VVARLAYYAYPPEQLAEGADGLSDPGRRVRDAVHAATGYDPALLASFLFLRRDSGEALAFSVVERRGAGPGAAAGEPPGDVPYRLEEDALLRASVRRPREGAPLYGVVTSPEPDEPTGDSARASFLLRGLRLTLTEVPEEVEAPVREVYELEYLFLHDRVIG
jgi:hypothetical protein